MNVRSDSSVTSSTASTCRTKSSVRRYSATWSATETSESETDTLATGPPRVRDLEGDLSRSLAVIADASTSPSSTGPQAHRLGRRPRRVSGFPSARTHAGSATRDPAGRVSACPRAILPKCAGSAASANSAQTGSAQPAVPSAILPRQDPRLEGTCGLSTAPPRGPDPGSRPSPGSDRIEDVHLSRSRLRPGSTLRSLKNGSKARSSSVPATNTNPSRLKSVITSATLLTSADDTTVGRSVRLSSPPSREPRA